MYGKTDFSNVKVGDKIVYRLGGYWNSRDVLTTVVKITPKQFVDDKQLRFRKEDGAMVGDSFRYARFATDEDIATFKERGRRAFLCNNIRSFSNYSDKLESFTIADLEAIYDIIKKYKEIKQD